MTIGHTAAPYVHIVMDDGLAHEIGAPEHAGPRRSEDNAASQVLTPAKPWGNQPVCEVCNRGKLSSCICNVPEPDVMSVEDMKLVMPELFGLPNGWSRIEL